jgi:hypothetical protein
MLVNAKFYVMSFGLSLAMALTSCAKKDKDDDEDEEAGTDGVGGGGGGGGGSGQAGTLTIDVNALSDDAAAALGLIDANTTSFNPVSYVVPIKTIYASTEASTATGSQTGSGQTLYTCSSDAEADCGLDLLDPEVVEATIGANVAIPAGTYKSIGYSFACGTVDSEVNADGQGIHVQVQATMEIAGTVYYTTSNGEVLTTDEEQYGPATVAMGGCGGKVYNLATDLVVEAGLAYKLNLFLMRDALGWASIDGQAANPAGCAVNGSLGICTNLPAIIPAIGELEVSTESYVVSSPEYCGNGLLSFVLDSASGEPFGVFLSRYYSEDLSIGPGSCWDAGTDRFSKNADGTFVIGADVGSGGSPRVLFNAFERQDHAGELSHDQSGTLMEGVVYTATMR